MVASGCGGANHAEGYDGIGIDPSGGTSSGGSAPATDDGAADDSANNEDADAGADADAGEESTGSGDGSAESSSGGPTCEQEMYSFDLAPSMDHPRVMLLLDKSRSMSNLWDHDLNPLTDDISRWNSLVNVVEFLTTEFADTVDFGAQLFPAASAYLDEPVNTYSCFVEDTPEVPVAPGTGPQIIASIPDAGDFSISGGTPTTAGILSALDSLESLPGNAPRAIVLITDGAANCGAAYAPDVTLFNYDDALPTTVQAVFEMHSIPVYVVGINILDELDTKPAVNPYEALSEVAMLGGVPSAGIDPFYNAFNEIDLADAVEQVVDHIECTVPLTEVPDFPGLVDVKVDGVTYDQVADCTTESGWAYTSPGGPYNAIELCGQACDDVQNAGTVSVDYGCPD